MFGIVRDPCKSCSHKKVCSMIDLYQNFVRELEQQIKKECIPTCVNLQVNCKYQDVDIRVRGR